MTFPALAIRIVLVVIAAFVVIVILGAIIIIVVPEPLRNLLRL